MPDGRTCRQCGGPLNRARRLARKCWSCLKGNYQEMKDRRSNHRVTLDIQEEVRAESDGTCEYCGEPPPKGQRLEWDHVHPIIRGGETSADNIVLACRACNRSKGSKTLEEWRGVDS